MYRRIDVPRELLASVLVLVLVLALSGLLFPGGPWEREVAVLGFARAAEHGSAVSTHMLAESQRGLAGPIQAIGR